MSVKCLEGLLTLKPPKVIAPSDYSGFVKLPATETNKLANFPYSKSDNFRINMFCVSKISRLSLAPA